MRPFIPHNRVTIAEDAIEQVHALLRSGQLAMGPACACLERELGAYLGRPHVMAVNSCTSALHLALLALKVRATDEVMLPSYVCISLYNAVIMAGMRARLVDVDGETANIDAAGVRRALSPRTRAIIVPHMFGTAANMDELLAFGVPVIEDITHAIGGRYRQHALGSLGAMAVVSFYATKMICGGEGGAVICGDPQLAERIRDMRDYTQARETWTLRYNYKISDIHAAIALAHLRKVDEAIRQRAVIADRYRRQLRELPGMRLPVEPPGIRQTYYRYIIRVPAEVGSPRIRERMHEMGVGAGDGVARPIHQQLGRADRAFPRSACWHHTAVSLPIYVSLSEGEQAIVVESLTRALCP